MLVAAALSVVHTALAAGGLAVGAPGPAAAPPPVDAAIAAAREAHAPLLLELSTSWCEPCQEMKKTVLPDPRVRRALAQVRFVSYDAEEGPGKEAEARFGDGSFPTFVVVDGAGVERLRAGGAMSVAELVAFVGRAMGVLLTEQDVLARVHAKPDDAAALVAAGRWYASRHQASAAAGFFDRAERADASGAQGVAADAAWERAGAVRRHDVVVALAAFATKYPRAARAETAAQVAALSGELSPAEVRRTLDAYVAGNANDADRLETAAGVAAAGGAVDAAERAARRLIALEPRASRGFAALAEALHARGDVRGALAAVDKAVARAPDDDARAEFTADRERYAKPAPGEGEQVRALRRAVDQELQDVSDPVLELGDVDNDGGEVPPGLADVFAFQRGVASAFDGVGDGCRAFAGSLSQAWVRVELRKGGGPPTKVTVLEPDAPARLKKCLVDALAKTKLPAPPDSPVDMGGAALKDGRFTGPVQLEAASD